jgi:NADP-dependent 3-hydroxy acid dehydrogenase YdfG
MSKAKPVCVITGVGDGTGASLAHRFTRGGYQVAMLARNRQRLLELQNKIADARAFECDISNLNLLSEVVDRVCTEMGQPSVLIHNAVSATFKTYLEAGCDVLEHNFRVNTTSLYQLARELAPAMVASGEGSIMVTGNTAAWRGIPTYAAIDTPWTREPFQSDKPDNFFSKPEDIAEGVFHVAHQPRSTWSFDVEIRPDCEKW